MIHVHESTISNDSTILIFQYYHNHHAYTVIVPPYCYAGVISSMLLVACYRECVDLVIGQ
jgi:hypothetical protein